MTAEARLVVLERVVGDATDAHMWVCFGGKERSTAAFEEYSETPASSRFQ